MVNKKIIIGVLLIFILALQIGCSQETNQTDLNNGKDTEQEQNGNSTANQDDKKENGIINEFNTIIEEGTELDEVIGFVNENISLLSKENASIMINRLEKEQKNYLSKLEEKFYSNNSFQSKMFEIYTSGLDINTTDNIDDDELKELLVKTKDSGYKVETAEGMFFPIIDYEFYKQYRSYLTNDMKEYIDIMAIESNKVPAKDAALIIGWDEVIERALNQEEFINNYPDSEKINDVVQLYENYVRFALYGLDNTPLFGYNGNGMADDAKNIYINAIENNEDSNLMRILRGFIEILEENDYKLTSDSENYRESVIQDVFANDFIEDSNK